MGIALEEGARLKGWVGSVKDLLIIEKNFIKIKEEIINHNKIEINKRIFDLIKKEKPFTYKKILEMRDLYIDHMEKKIKLFFRIEYENTSEIIENGFLEKALNKIDLDSINTIEINLISNVKLARLDYSFKRCIIVVLSKDYCGLVKDKSNYDEYNDRIIFVLKKREPIYLKYKLFIINFIYFGLYFFGFYGLINDFISPNIWIFKTQISIIFSSILSIGSSMLIGRLMPEFEIFENYSKKIFIRSIGVLFSIVTPLIFGLLPLLK